VNRTTRLIVATIVAIIGGYLLIRAADPATPAGPAFLFFGIGLILFLATAIFLFRYFTRGNDEFSTDEIAIREWSFSRFLSRAKDAAPLWIGLRIFLAYEWIEAGRHKLEDPAWIQTGTALQGFWQRVVAVPEPPGRPLITYPAYREIIQFMLDNQWYTWFAKVITIGEILIGIGFLVGGFIGIAAFFALLLNFSFIFAGSTSSNPLLIILEGMIAFWAWRSAGWFGLDRFLLPLIGTPWAPGPRASADVPPRAVDTRT
jgi:thiosulfate dehydrogenase [quinone] large subunit